MVHSVYGGLEHDHVLEATVAYATLICTFYYSYKEILLMMTVPVATYYVA